jgi:hypothetical protein
VIDVLAPEAERLTVGLSVEAVRLTGRFASDDKNGACLAALYDPST